MRFYFTDEDNLTFQRSGEVRAALVHAHHHVRRGELGEPAPSGTDVWFHGMGVHGAPPLGPALVDSLMASSAEIVLAQLCDHPTMSFERIPDALAARTRLFLRNHWPSNEAEIPIAFRSRIGLLPPMLKTMAPKAGAALERRSHGSIFYGSRTGFSNLGEGKNAREETVRKMRASGLPFLGGVLPHAEARYTPAPELSVPRMKRGKHTRLLGDSRICIAPWGNHPLSYRFFEGMALRCLVVAQSLAADRFLDGGLVSGRHYVETAPDLSDLVEVVRYYLSHLDEAQKIADAGHEHFAKYLTSRGDLISGWIFDAMVGSWKDLYRPADDVGIKSSVLSVAARLAPKLF